MLNKPADEAALERTNRLWLYDFGFWVNCTCQGRRLADCQLSIAYLFRLKLKIESLKLAKLVATNKLGLAQL